jgi:hypothetical protein
MAGIDAHARIVDHIRNVDALVGCVGDMRQTHPCLQVIKALEDFIETIKTDEDRFVPRDGTVHQVTSSVRTEL